MVALLRPNRERNHLTSHLPPVCSPQDSQAKIRIHGSRKKGTVVQAGNVASNGVIHLINKLMDSVSPIVESEPQVNHTAGMLLLALGF